MTEAVSHDAVRPQPEPVDLTGARGPLDAAAVVLS